MKMFAPNINETNASDAFCGQSAIFDHLYSANSIIRYKRERVRDHVLQYLPARSRILELNSGTGEDAVFFAGQGHQVHATDISPGMQQQLMLKVKKHELENKISNELCSYTVLDQLQNKGPYDLIFSNFAGLNCTNELDKVFNSFSSLLKQNGVVTLIMLPEFCLWETMLLFKGSFGRLSGAFSVRKEEPLM